MKQLQNNFTTPEQSKWLLKILGVPADSADMYYQNALLEPRIIPVGRKYKEYTDNIIGINRELWYFTPCWSVGRLIEIMMRCSTADPCFIFDKADDRPIIDFMIESIETKIKAYMLDFSKLEE